MVDILYILGTQRSGSTAFERFLASHENTVAIGEARSLWSQRATENRPCSCGSPVDECPFWTSVRMHAFGPTGKADHEPLRIATRYVDRPQYVPMMHHKRLRTRRFREALPVAHDVIGRFYDGIAHAAPGRLVVESTKIPWYGHLLSTIPNVRVAFVHLVRDSRAVAFSQQRRRGTNPVGSALTWDVKFAFSLALAPYVKPRFMHVRYEDFATDPERAAARVQDLLEASGLPPLGPRHGDAERTWYHAAIGNRMRHTKNFVVRPDEEWRTSFPAHQRALVGALTLPFLVIRRRYAVS